VRLSQIGDVGGNQGSQLITFRKGAKTGHVTVIVSARTAYIRGDAFTLVNYMGLKAAPAAKYADVWILIPRTNSFYSTVAQAVTLSSTINELRLSKPLSMLPQTTVDGQRVVGVVGKPSSSSTSSATAKLYARAAGSPLPVKQISTQGTTRSTVVFSNWNEPVHVTVPATALPISTTGLE